MCLGTALLALSGSPILWSQTFSSGSDGSDGAYAPSGPPGTVIVFDPSQFSGSHVSACVFNFTTITIPEGITVRLSGNKLNCPVYWLAQGDVNIAGVLDLSGGKGQNWTANSFTRALAGVPGAGGYAGGVGGSTAQLPLDGSGGGGGSRAKVDVFTFGQAGGGKFSGNSVLLPLVGGSGGGGAVGKSSALFQPGGGAGGGAIVIASSTSILVNGSILVSGGAAGASDSSISNFSQDEFRRAAGGGSGGAIRLVSNTIMGSGLLESNGGLGTVLSNGTSLNTGGAGRIRLEAFTNNFTGSIQGQSGSSVPNVLLVPTAGSPTARVISIGGAPVSPNPDTFPDIVINTTAPVDVVIETRQVPPTATILLTILGEAGAPDTVVTAPQLGNCSASNVCTTTVQVSFGPGASRGLTRVTWTQ